MTSPEEGRRDPVPTLNIANVLTTVRIALVPFFVWFLLADDGRQGALRWAARTGRAVRTGAPRRGR